MNIIKTSIALLHAAVVAALLPLPGLAQAPGTGDLPILEELIVTAQKREQNLQDVPVGGSLISGRARQEAQIKNASELATLLPTLNVQASSGPSTSSFNIRGIGTQAFSPGVDPSVSTMLDGVVIPHVASGHSCAADESSANRPKRMNVLPTSTVNIYAHPLSIVGAPFVCPAVYRLPKPVIPK